MDSNNFVAWLIVDVMTFTSGQKLGWEMLSVLAFSDIILLCLMLLSTVDFKRINALAPIKHYYTLFFLTKTVETHDCEVHPSGVCVWMVCVCMDGVCVWMVCGWAVGEFFHGYSSLSAPSLSSKSFIHLNSFKQNSISGCNFSSELNTFPFLIDFCTWRFCYPLVFN